MPRVEQYLSKIKVIRRIAGKIIDFLAQLEDFQKKLWLKKKFVVETQYCITVGSIPETFYAEISANEAQRKEWVKLFGIEEKLKPEFLKTIRRSSWTHSISMRALPPVYSKRLRTSTSRPMAFFSTATTFSL